MRNKSRSVWLQSSFPSCPCPCPCPHTQMFLAPRPLGHVRASSCSGSPQSEAWERMRTLRIFHHQLRCPGGLSNFISLSFILFCSWHYNLRVFKSQFCWFWSVRVWTCYSGRVHILDFILWTWELRADLFSDIHPPHPHLSSTPLSLKEMAAISIQGWILSLSLLLFDPVFCHDVLISLFSML